jgi:hypothetical protein
VPTESPRESAYATYHEEEVNPVPVYVNPRVESTAEPFIPYRGTQMHGVDPGRIQPVEDEDAEGGKVVTGYFEPPEADINPVPVRIVGAAATEFKQFRTYQVTVTSTPVMVVSQKLGRSSASVVMVGGLPVYLGPDSSVNPTNGYPIGVSGNMESSFNTLAEAPVWAVCAPTDSATVAVHTEFSTPQ